MSRISSMAYKRLPAVDGDGRRSQSNPRLVDDHHNNGRFSSPRHSRIFHHKAFEHASSYDESVAFRLLHGGLPNSRFYAKDGLKSSEAAGDLFTMKDEMPLKVLNGSPGYVNILDALNGWQLVRELSEATGVPAAASFRHLSPAGVAIGLPLNAAEVSACLLADVPLDEKRPSLSAAYARARGVERMSAFGDMIALSEKCDELTAKIIIREVSDGVVAPDFDSAALSLLVKKKGGNYIVLRIDPQYLPSETEERRVFGLKLRQKRNNVTITPSLFTNVVGKHKELPKSAVDDLIVATLAIKYAQSNSVCIAHRGHVIGLGAGQSSRLHCSRLAGDKAASWYLRLHPRLQSLPWRPNLRRSERAAAVDLLATARLDQEELEEQLATYFSEPVQPFTQEERLAWLAEQSGSSLASDSFILSRDTIDCANKCGVKYIAQPAGSAPTDDVIAACDQHGIAIVHTGIRLSSTSSNR